MPLKKSELYSSIWKTCDELRGGMDASQYKDYVLVLLFVKYVSDRYAGRKGADLHVPEGARFQDMVALGASDELGEKINKILEKLAGATGLRGVLDIVDFNDEDKLGKGKEKRDRLSNLIAIFNKPELNFSGNRADGDDLLGDAYEYLMRHFATESGKSKGQFYTPAEVSRIIAKVIDVAGVKGTDQSIHDPTCGSGSLLLKAHDEAKARTGKELAIYGQEMDNATWALARMNMILHGCADAEVEKDNTLARPLFKNDKTGKLKTFDFVVANPPFSSKAWSNGLTPGEDEYKRFAYGVPPAKNGDYAFLLHILTVMKPTGKGAVILPHGVLFRGNAEATIRKELVGRGYIKGLIGLPPNLFYGTGIPACIVVLDKAEAAARRGIFMIDASRSFLKDGNKNRLRERDLHRIVDVFTRQLDVPGYARFVPRAEIEQNEFNLNLPRYIDSSEPEDLHDIEAHLRGGIPACDIDALGETWKVLPELRAALFEEERPGYLRLRVPATEVKVTIFGHPEFTAFHKRVSATFARWKKENLLRLTEIAKGDRPKALIEALSESALAMFGKVKLVDAYAVFQHLMDYWAETMQDDVYEIVAVGWVEAARLRIAVDDPKLKIKEKPDLVVGGAKYKADVVPPGLIVARFFAREQKVVEQLEGEVAGLELQVEEMREERGGDEGSLAEARDDRGNVNKAAAKARLKEIKDDPEAAEEVKALEEYLELEESLVGTRKKLKEAQDALDKKVFAKYGELTEQEVKALVVEDKWLVSLGAAVQGELDRVSHGLSGRIGQLADRYALPMPDILDDVTRRAGRVDEHLRKMGALWS